LLLIQPVFNVFISQQQPASAPQLSVACIGDMRSARAGLNARGSTPATLAGARTNTRDIWPSFGAKRLAGASRHRTPSGATAVSANTFALLACGGRCVKRAAVPAPTLVY